MNDLYDLDKDQLLAALLPYRKLRPRPPLSDIEPVGPGEESVWAYPRPPVVQSITATLRIVHGGVTIAETARAKRVVETSGAPVYYFPPDDVADGYLTPTDEKSACEWKGLATYFDLTVAGDTVASAAFCYPEPFDDLGMGYAEAAGWIAFYANRVDEAWVGNERARPQPGGFYAGWVTDAIKGPVKGEPGSEGW